MQLISLGSKILKKTRDKDVEAKKWLTSQMRLMTWVFKISNAEHKPLKDQYDTLISTHVKRSTLRDMKASWGFHIPDILLSENVTMSLLLYHLYFTELSFNPWGLATSTALDWEYRSKDGKKLTQSRFPNFLMPLDCLYCGEDLGFKTFSDTSIMKTKHEGCSGVWNKGIKKKHRQLMQYIELAEKSELLFEQVWQCYKEMAGLYESPYRPRYTLIQEYSHIQNDIWMNPLVGIKNSQQFLKLPFIQIDAESYYLSLALDEDDSDCDPRRKKEQTYVLLSEMDKYFVKTPS